MEPAQLRDFYRGLRPVDTGYELIRIGRDGDGGYLVPNCLSGIELCLSPGTCHNIDFEMQLWNMYGIPSLLCDPSHPVPRNLPPELVYWQLALADVDTAHTMTFDTWLDQTGHRNTSPLLLSMDIEGAESQIIPR